MPEQTIRIKCPNLTCQKILAVPLSSRGKNVRCRSCANTIRIPSAPKPIEQTADKDAAQPQKA